MLGLLKTPTALNYNGVPHNVEEDEAVVAERPQQHEDVPQPVESDRVGPEVGSLARVHEGAHAVEEPPGY
eukprot:CAMPEP_0180133488 /NCGR_PEP_ID=MMETSP0986-20121125/9573_1 /TAXON_ID=697907 /ORGANISM="non described non described, Strain CCMP2293" /LENGTH=69 /DNA_ID=CAMNT_0022073621 /DNA_START=181 /DNA_END=389 /DNA_ORIENTATION=-